MVASSAIGAIGSIKQGQAQRATYQAQAQAMDYNAQVEKMNADAANQQTNVAEEQQRRKFRMLQGQAAAAAAQSGAGLDGSNKDVLEQNALLSELDALTIRYEGKNRAQSFESQSELSKYQARAARQNADAAMDAAYLNAGANLLAGATNYQMYSKVGIGAGGQGGFRGIKLTGVS